MRSNDLKDWFPILKAISVPVPRTEILETKCDLRPLLDGKEPAGYQKIGYPVFLRTGHLSGKHRYRHTCYVEAPEVLALAEESFHWRGARWRLHGGWPQRQRTPEKFGTEVDL